MQKSIRFFIRMLPVFFARVKPASHREKPACMKNTRAAPTSTQIVLTALNVILINSFRKICVCKTAEPPVAQVEQKRRPGKIPRRLCPAVWNTKSASQAVPAKRHCLIDLPMVLLYAYGQRLSSCFA